jgi:hypothetical protein
MLPKLANWASVAGLAVGIVGLIYSVLAFLEAGKARKSAEDARRAVRALVAADKLQHLGSKAKELYGNVNHENWAVAAFLAADLRFEINGAITRWDFLDPATKEHFKEASQLAMRVSEFMRSRQQLEPNDKTKLLKKCDSILAILSGESGKIQGDIEGGSQS